MTWYHCKTLCVCLEYGVYAGITTETKVKRLLALRQMWQVVASAFCSLYFLSSLKAHRYSETKHDRVCTEPFYFQCQAICRSWMLTSWEDLDHTPMGKVWAAVHNDSSPLTAEDWHPSHSGCWKLEMDSGASLSAHPRLSQPLQNCAPFCHVNWDIVIPLIRTRWQ